MLWRMYALRMPAKASKEALTDKGEQSEGLTGLPDSSVSLSARPLRNIMMLR